MRSGVERVEPGRAAPLEELAQTRRSATRLAASWARRSPLRTRRRARVREHEARTPRRSAAPAGGSAPPGRSRSIRRASTPGTIPPTSEWWARVTPKPIVAAARDRRDERDVGEVRPARERIVEHADSPGSGSRAITAATASGIAPRCTGMCSACATIRPRASKSAAEQSRRSLMFDEYALRTSTVPISSATPQSARAITARVTGPSARPQDERAAASSSPSQPGAHEAGRLGQLDDRRPRDTRPRPSARGTSPSSRSSRRVSGAPAGSDGVAVPVSAAASVAGQAPLTTSSSRVGPVPVAALVRRVEAPSASAGP